MSANNRRIADLISDVDDGRLEVRPFFQRRLVWTNTDKENLIDTILKGFPFPEIFIATGQLDLKNIKRKNWLVDGQQRITTVRGYVHGTEDLLYKSIERFDALSPERQTAVLDYEVAVRDLGTRDEKTIREIFKRINSTDYALKGMEVLNAMFNGKFNQFCLALSKHPFFATHKVFSKAVEKRMYDVTFCVILVSTVLGGYYRRDERNHEYLERYNDEFSQDDEVLTGLEHVFDFIERCEFDAKSRAWKQTDLFTLVVELYNALNGDKLPLVPEEVGTTLSSFFARVDEMYKGGSLPDQSKVPKGQSAVLRYLKAATKATTDKYARVERAEIISALLRSGDAVRDADGTNRPRKRTKSRQGNSTSSG